MKISWPLVLLLTIILGAVALILAFDSDAHLVQVPDKPGKSKLENRLAQQSENLYHARYVCRNGRGPHRAFHCHAATGWLLHEWQETRAALRPRPAWWITRQIAVAEMLGRDGDAQRTDPWPECPDPYDHRGASWVDTLACENRAYFERYGNTPRAWLDSPGYYRCGLQFDPMWERRYGRLCP